MKLTIKYLSTLVLLFAINSSSAQLNKVYFFYQGQRLLSENKFKESIRYLNTLIETDSTLFEAWFLRGVAKYYLEDSHGAIKDLSKTIELNPVFTQAYHYRANAENQLSLYKEALKDLNYAIELKPNNPEYIFSRGVTYFQVQQYLKAIEDFSKVIRIIPNNSDAWLNRATSKLLIGDTIGSINDFGSAIKTNPFYADSYSRRSRVYLEQGKNALALLDINNAIRLDSTSTINYFTRALIRNSSGNINGALEDFDKVISLDPDNSHSLYNRALIKSQIGDLNSALNDYNRLVKLNPENVFAYYNRAAVLLDLNRFLDAINDYSKAIELYPDFANAYINRSVAKTKIGDMKGAEKDYNTANQKIQKYNTSSQEALAAMADTSEKFNKLIAFNTNFYSNNRRQLLSEEANLSTDFLPFFIISISKTDRTSFFRDDDYTNLNLLSKELSSGYKFCFTRKVSNFFVADSIIQASTYGLKKLISGLQFSNIKKYNQSLDQYQKAIESDSDLNLFKINLAVEKIEMTRYIQQFDDDISTITMGNGKSRNDGTKSTNYNYQEALSILKEIEKQEPNLSVLPYNIGNTFVLLEDLESSITSYSQAIQLNPSFSEAFYNRGLAFLISGQKEKGCIDISKAGELGINQAYTVIQKFCK